MGHKKLQTGAGQVVPLAVVAGFLLIGYVAIEIYSEDQKERLIVETRGSQMISALAAHKRENGAYPDSLDKLVPKYILTVGKCPGGTSMTYSVSGGEYSLSCRNVVFKYKPYIYSSRSRSWSG
jgi:hypothetical protein